MQSQMIGMQSSLDRILTAVQPQIQTNPAASQPQPYSSSPRRDSAGYAIPTSTSRNGESFPPLPGFAPPVSIYAINKIFTLTIY